jgi:hypothetical protein
LTLFLKVLEKQQETTASTGFIAQKVGSNRPGQPRRGAPGGANQGIPEKCAPVVVRQRCLLFIFRLQ